MTGWKRPPAASQASCVAIEPLRPNLVQSALRNCWPLGGIEIRVQMPHGHAQRNAGVKLLFGGALGHGVHGADEFIAVGSFFVEQGGRARSIEREGFEE